MRKRRLENGANHGCRCSRMLHMILMFSVILAKSGQWKGTKIMEVVFSSIKATDYFSHACSDSSGDFTIFVYVVGLWSVWIFRADIRDFSLKLSVMAPSRSSLLQCGLLHYLKVFMYVVLSAFLGSHNGTIEDSGKAISPLMMLVLFSFLGATTLGSAGDVFLWKIGSYIPFISTFFMPFRTING